MQLIINFFEYTLSGGLYFIYFVVMIICSLACVGVVGEKVSKRKQAELIAKREALAKEESEKAKEMVKKQAESYGVSNVLDPTAKKAQTDAPVASNSVQQGVPEVAVPVIGESSDAVVEEAPQEEHGNVEEKVITSTEDVVDERKIEEQEIVQLSLRKTQLLEEIKTIEEQLKTLKGIEAAIMKRMLARRKAELEDIEQE